MPRIQTERLILRRFHADDAEDLFEILGDPIVMEQCEPAYDRTKTEHFLKTFCIERGGALAAEHRKSGRVIGYLLFCEARPGEYEIGWFFRRDCWRQGYAFEACRALIDDAFSRRGAHRIFAETIDPLRSVGLMEKLGMRREQVLPDHVTAPDGRRADWYLYGLTNNAGADRRIP